MVLCGIAQMERETIAERTQKGLESARARGRVGGRPPKNDKAKVALAMYDSGGYSIGAITKETGISKRTLYNYLNARKVEDEANYEEIIYDEYISK